MNAIKRLNPCPAALLPLALLLLMVAAGCATLHPHQAPPPAADPTALTVTAEVALKRGDCRAAAESYA
ncbi:MAG: hypothetical protein ACRETP_12485, partial [Steroidobacteraceae bacterium]